MPGMSILLARLLEQLKARGLSVAPGDEPGVMVLRGPNEEKTQQIIDAVKAFKPELLEMFNGIPLPPKSEPKPAPEPVPAVEPERCQVTCRVCGIDASDPEDRERLADAAFCDRGGGKARLDMDGTRHPEEPRCPFKPRV